MSRLLLFIDEFSSGGRKDLDDGVYRRYLCVKPLSELRHDLLLLFLFIDLHYPRRAEYQWLGWGRQRVEMTMPMIS